VRGNGETMPADRSFGNNKPAGCGWLDRLIVNDYRQRGLTTMTHDRKMGALPGTTRL
jgi:hypothetical protein